MSTECGHAQSVRLQNGGVSLRIIILHPGQQCGAKVETYAGVIILDFLDGALILRKDPGCPIGRITFSGDALIPIVVRMCGILQFDDLQPRILSRRLIEMAVNANVSGRIGIHLRDTFTFQRVGLNAITASGGRLMASERDWP